MNTPPIRYAVLRHHRVWDGVVTTRLEPETDGALTLASVPGAVDGHPVIVPGPYEPEPSGLAVNSHGGLYLADGNRLLWCEPFCNSCMSQAERASSIAVLERDLYVADADAGIVAVYSLPSVERHAEWSGPLQRPAGLAQDRSRRIYVLDRGGKRVFRFDARGAPDPEYNAAMQAHMVGASPAFCTVDDHETLYVSDAASNRVLRFDASGGTFAPLASAIAEAPRRPRALVAHGGRLYIADAENGCIFAYDAVAGIFLGIIPDYSGPIAAIAVGASGVLLIKPGADRRIYRLEPRLAHMDSGRLSAGPLDAGEQSRWERAHVSADIPDGTSVVLQTFTGGDPASPPNDSAWVTASGFDTLLPRSQRYLWLRVLMRTHQPHAAPRLLQVQAETTGESYMDYLPAIYRREDAATGFLQRFLALLRSELGGFEAALEAIPRLCDPAMTAEENLPWLASWLGFAPPEGLRGDGLRALLDRLPELYPRRGTSAGLRLWVELYTGIRVHVFEAFHERRIWQLGVSSLGFNTGLVPAAPDGMIVPGLTVFDLRYSGLRGDYYRGTRFEEHVLARTDPTIDFDWGLGSPDPKVPADRFSVLWTGQIQPLYSESYAFSTISDDGVRLWVDGRLLIDDWTDHAAREDTARIALNAGEWYPIRLEYYEQTQRATIQLYWSSRSQIHEIVPARRLYSVLDDTVSTTSDSPSAEQVLLVGQTVVGSSGPLAKSDFGLSLFSETAHLFTVAVSAAHLRAPHTGEAVRRIIDAEKPAHTDYHFCIFGAEMRLGYQSRVGVDSVVAGPPPALEVDSTRLGLDSYLGGTDEDRGGCFGERGRLGRETVIG